MGLFVVKYMDRYGVWRAAFPTRPLGMPMDAAHGFPYALDRIRQLGFEAKAVPV